MVGLKWWQMPLISYRSWLVVRRNLMVFKKTWLTNIGFNFIEPLLYLTALGLGLGAYVKEIQGLPYIQWIAPGLIASSAMWATAIETTYDSFMRMKYQRIYHAIAATPISLEEVVVGEMLFGTFKSLLYGSVFLLVIFIAGLVPAATALLVPLVLVISGLIFAELGITWTGLVPKTDHFSYFFTLIITPMFLFGGIFFPLEGMPAVVQAVAWLTPLYHSVQLIRSLVLGQYSWLLFGHAAWLATFAVIFFRIPLFLVRKKLVQ
ncbi:MAG: ABC transporter permease [Bacillota bacterium]